MGPKDETSAKAAEIGDGLIESLGFEPADGKKFGRNAVAGVSDQLSEAGFSVTDVLEGVSDDPPASSGDANADSTNGSAAGNGSRSGSAGAGAALADGVTKTGSDTGSVPNGSSTSQPSASSSKSSLSSPGSNVSAAATAATAAISAKVGQVGKGSGAGAGAGAGSPRGHGAEGDVLDVVPFSPDAKVPTSPPTADQAPAVTGEIPRVDARAETPSAVMERRPMVVDNRTIVDRPRSVSDLFSGGITGRRRLQARKVRRVIRHIDPWSVLTFSVMFHLCLFAALLLASALVFNVAEEAGTIENLESFIRELGDYETFEIDGQAIFKAAVAIAGIMTLAASVLVVLLTVMFNLLSDLLGGVRITVIEEETVRVKPKKSDEDDDE